MTNKPSENTIRLTMTESKPSLYVVPCSGVNNDLKTPVNVSVALEVGRIGLSIGCPFAKEFSGDDSRLTTRCVAPVTEGRVSEAKAKKFPVCYHLERKSSF